MAKYQLTRKCGHVQTVKLFGAGHTQAALDKLQDTPCDDCKPRKVGKAPELAMPYGGNVTAPSHADRWNACPASVKPGDFVEVKIGVHTHDGKMVPGEIEEITVTPAEESFRGQATLPNGRLIEYAILGRIAYDRFMLALAAEGIRQRAKADVEQFRAANPNVAAFAAKQFA